MEKGKDRVRIGCLKLVGPYAEGNMLVVISE